jgi:hypothetical protein
MCFDLYNTPSVIQKSASQNINLRDFSIFFLLLAFYLLVLISYTKTNNLKIVASSYDLAVSIYFVMLAIALKIAFSFSQLNKKLAKISVQGLLLVGVGVVIYQIILPNVPEITAVPGIVLWNVGTPILLITGLMGLIVGHFWAYIFYKNFKDSTSKISQIKSFLIMISSSALGFSSLTYFYQNEVSMIASFAFGFVGVFGMLIASILKPRK